MASLYSHDSSDGLHIRTIILGLALIGAIGYGVIKIFTLFLAPEVIPGFPVVGRSDKEWSRVAAQRKFMANASAILEEGAKLTNNGIFQVCTVDGPALIMPPKYLEEIKNHPDLPMATRSFFEHYPAFSVVKSAEGHVLVDMVNKKLTPSLALTTAPVNDETEIAMNRIWPATKEWKPTTFLGDCMESVSQVSSRIFLGAPLCRDPQWIQCARDFTVQLMIGVYAMRFTPWILRPAIYMRLKQIQDFKKTIKKARKIIDPEIAQRRKVRAEALARGEKIPKHLDSIQWFDEVVSSDFDFAAGQLMLSFVAIHTTSNTLFFVMLDLLEHPELLEELREEVVACIKEDGGLKKTTLYKMKLLDSIMKESQRLNILSKLLLQRETQTPLTLSDGIQIPKKTRLIFPSNYMRSNEYYEDAETFDGKRFLRLREKPENTNRYQFVTASAEHTGFGYGTHACPGRFFASNEIKVMLIHLILKYEFKFKDGARPVNLRPEAAERIADPAAQLLYRSRTPEVDLARMEVQA